MTDRVCAWCGADISHLRSNAKWCQNGNKCAAQAYRHKHVETARERCREYHARKFAKNYDEKQCSWCGSTFKPRSHYQHACSKKCGSMKRDYDRRAKTKNDYAQIQCVCCGTWFTPDRFTARFCSQECKRLTLDAERYDRIRGSDDKFEKFIRDGRRRYRTRAAKIHMQECLNALPEIRAMIASMEAKDGQ